MISDITTYTMVPDMSKYTDEERFLLDAEGVSKHYVKLTIKDITDEYIAAVRDFAKHQYKLPMKFLKPIHEAYSYVAQKSQIVGDEHDPKNASVTIEPLNPNFPIMISYTPINQSLPLGTIVTIHESIPYDWNPGDPPLERRFLWSRNLKTDDNITDVIKRANPNSINLNPWIMSNHYGSIDIGSTIDAKFEVSEVDPNIYESFAMFRFNRCDDKKEFVIYTYDCYNVTPKDVCALMSKTYGKRCPEMKKFCDEIVERYPSK